MKTTLTTIATTNQDNHSKKIGKRLLFDLCKQIRKNPVPIHNGKLIIGITSGANTELASRLNVQMDIHEHFLIKGTDCYFIPICDDVDMKKLNGIDIITKAKIIGVSMVKEHYDKSIDPIVFDYEVGKDYFILNGEFTTKEMIDDIIFSGKAAHFFYSGEWLEEEVKKDAREKGIMKPNLDQTISINFQICHDPPEKTFEKFTEKIKKVWTSTSLEILESQKTKPNEKKSIG